MKFFRALIKLKLTFSGIGTLLGLGFVKLKGFGSKTSTKQTIINISF